MEKRERVDPGEAAEEWKARQKRAGTVAGKSSAENLMMDMAMEDEKAVWLLDQITEKAIYRRNNFV